MGIGWNIKGTTYDRDSSSSLGGNQGLIINASPGLINFSAPFGPGGSLSLGIMGPGASVVKCFTYKLICKDSCEGTVEIYTNGKLTYSSN